MLKIFICDDEHAMRQSIEDIIQKQIMIHEYDMNISLSCDKPEVLLNKLNSMSEKRHIYFLDVDLKNDQYDGFLLGKEIRKIDPNGTIIYITSYKDLAYKTFQYHIEAFDYIVKDSIEQLSSSISSCLSSIVSRLSEEKSDPIDCYTMRTGDVVKHIFIDDIYYIETSPRAHYVILHGKNIRIEFIGNLSDLEKELGSRFMKIHRSYLIALNKIDELDLKHNRVIVRGNDCQVSRKMKSILLEAMSRK